MKRTTLVAVARKALSLAHGLNPIIYGLAVAAGLAVSPSSQAQGTPYIGLDFQGRNGPNTAPGRAIPAATTAGVVPQANWNAFNNFGPPATAVGSAIPLNDASGTATPVTVSFDGNDSWNNDDPEPTAASSGDDMLMYGAIKRQTAGSSMSITFAGVPASSTGWYDVILYTASNNDNVRLNNRIGAKTFYTIGAHQWVNGSAAAGGQPAIPARTFRQAKNEIDPAFGGVADLGNYVKFAGVAPDASGNLVIVSTYVSGGDGLGIAGVQLITGAAAPVDTTPPTPLLTQVTPANAYFLVTFSEPVDAASLATATFTLNNGATATAGGVSVNNAAGTQVRVNVTGVNPDTAYTVTVAGVKDSFGNTFNGTVNFRTAARITTDVSGFPNLDGYQSNGGATAANGVLTLTSGVNGQTRSVFSTGVVNINQSFNAEFVYVATGAADGIAFAVHGDPRGAAALGGGGGALGFNGILNSFGLMLNIYTGGNQPKGYRLSTSADPGYGDVSINFSSGHPILVQLRYNPAGQFGPEVRIIFTDLVTGQSSTNDEVLNSTIRDLVGSDFAFVGFTGATGGANSVQKVQNFRFSANALAPTPVAIISQPANIRVLAGSTARFEVGVNAPATFQWFKGAAALPGETQAFLEVPNVQDPDNNALYHVVVTGGAGTTGNVVTSADAKLTVGHLTFIPGYLVFEMYQPGGSGDKAAIHAGTFGAPSSSTLRTSADNPDQGGGVENFVSKTYGYITPTADGDYTLFLALDDDGELYLSTDEDPANARQIAGQTTWSGTRQWLNMGDGAQDTGATGQLQRDNKRSDLFLQRTQGASAPVPIPLQKDHRYYVEMISHEGGGGDNSAFTMVAFGTAPANGTATTLTGNLIGANLLTGDTVTFTTQPVNQTVPSATKATFTVAVSNQFPSYQWQRAPSGSSTYANIPGATGASYTTDFLPPSESGSKYRVVVTIPGSSGTSDPATLTVETSGTPAATITGAGTIGDKEVGIEFDTLIDATTGANAANYSVAGSTIASIKVVSLSNGTKAFSIVKLTLATPLAGATANVSVVGSGLKDINGNTILATTKSVNVNKLTHKDIGNLPGDPIMPGDAIAAGNGAFDVTAGGTDIWNQADGFHFVYAPVKGDFEVTTRVEYVLPVNNWSAGALMARETLLPPSRNWHVKLTPPAVPTTDGGTGAASFETNRRMVTAGDAAGWGGTTGPGNKNVAAYPNQFIKLTRVGQVFTVFRKQAAAAEWEQVQTEDLATLTNGTDGEGNPIPIPPMPEIMYVGAATTSHNNSLGAQFVTTVLYRDFGIVGEIVADPATGQDINVSVVRNANGSLTITWNGGAGKLTQNSVLGTTTGWSDVPNGGASPVTITPAATGNVFYRVEK